MLVTGQWAAVAKFLVICAIQRSLAEMGDAVQAEQCVTADCSTDRFPHIFVCVPTAPRVSGREHAPITIASVRAGNHPPSAVKIMVQHDPAVSRPKGADFYIERPKHAFDSPCRFHRWRANLVLDFMHLMQAAVNQSNASHIMWLEDDVVLSY